MQKWAFGAFSMCRLLGPFPCMPLLHDYSLTVPPVLIHVIHFMKQVFVYQKSFPMPVLSFKFNSIDPLAGQEVEDSNQFVSSVCWRGQSSTLVAANSTGNIKLLEMVWFLTHQIFSARQGADARNIWTARYPANRYRWENNDTLAGQRYCYQNGAV